MSQDQLAKLQEALIEGRIDKETYDSLKADLLSAGKATPANPEPDEPPPVEKPETAAEKFGSVKKSDGDSPWATGRVQLKGLGGFGFKSNDAFSVSIRGEVIGEGTIRGGFDLKFELILRERVPG